MIHFKNKTEEGFEFWFTNGISECDIEKLQREFSQVSITREVSSSEIEFLLTSRLEKNHYIYYAKEGVIGVDQLDNYDD